VRAVLLLDPGVPLDWVPAAAKTAVPDASATTLPIHELRALRRSSDGSGELALDRYDLILLPFRLRLLTHPRYWRGLLFVGGKGRADRRLLDPAGNLLTARALAANIFWPLIQPLLALGNLVLLPWYTVTQVVGRFALAREDRDDEFVGFGAGKGSGGLVYWNALARQARRAGPFGIAHESHYGAPLSVHSWPLALIALERLGFRRLVGLSALLVVAALVWLSRASGHPATAWLAPIVLLSPYALFNVSVATWEVLAWGFVGLAQTAFIVGHPIAAGVLIGAAVTAHPGTAALGAVAVAALVTGGFGSLPALIAFGLAVAVASSWFVVPYWRSRDRLGRGPMINAVWEYSYRWTRPRAYQGVLYFLFAVATIVFGGWTFAPFVMLPLAALWYNVKRNWVFSAYTVNNFMLLTGALALVLHPAILPIVLYLLVVFSSGDIIWPNANARWGFDLTPVKLGDARTRIRSAFATLSSGRTAFELGRRDHKWNDLAAISYVLADTGRELLNTAYVEIGDHALYEKYARHFHAEATAEEVRAACVGTGTRYVVAFTDEFAALLQQCGATMRAHVDDLSLSPEPAMPPTRFSIFEMPWATSLVEPPASLEQSRNRMRFAARAGESYLLKYTAFRGWRATQGGKPLPIGDAKPGMLIRAPENGDVELRYSYRNYFRPEVRA